MCFADINENKQNWRIEMRRKFSKNVGCSLWLALTNQLPAMKSSELVCLPIKKVAFITNHLKLLAIVSMCMPTYLYV